MLLKELDRYKFSLCILILLTYFLSFFGKPERGSSRVAYLIIGAFALASFIINQIAIYKGGEAPVTDKYKKRVLMLFGSLFGLITVYANYEMYIEKTMGSRIFTIVLLFLSSVAVFISIFRFCCRVFSCFDIRNENTAGSAVKWFFGCFIVLSAFYLTIFYLCSYPGQICSDSLNQIKQVIYGNYSNHHPVYQTWIIGFFFKIGMALFNDVNDAVAMYTVFQILFMSAAFAYSIATMIQAGSKRLFAVLWLVWFMLTPGHLIFSFTLWKDSLYGAVVLIFTVSLFRILKHIGRHKILNYVILSLSAVGFNLLRSNGMPAFLLLLAVFALFCFFFSDHSEKKTILISCAAALLLAVIMKYPVLKAMNIPQADTVEMLSIPVQQVTRIARETDDFTDRELEVIAQIAPIERLREQYNPKIYDYARDVIRYEGNQQYISDHPLKCLGTWFSIVTRHPFIATKAWVDQTSGYWNPSSYYWMKWWDGVCEEEGLHLIVNNPRANDAFHTYVRQFTDENAVLGLSYSVGLHVWIILFFVAYSVYQRRRDYIFALPVLCLVFTLLIATLMHDEFRFGYPIYTCFPMIIFACLGYKSVKSAKARKAAKVLKSSSADNNPEA